MSTDYLQLAKQDKITLIDKKTESLIDKGFYFGGVYFSLSKSAQINWIGLKTMQDVLTWPVAITTLSDGEYSLALSDLDSFISTGSYCVQYHLATGRELKLLVNASTTIEDVNSIVDNRE